MRMVARVVALAALLAAGLAAGLAGATTQQTAASLVARVGTNDTFTISLTDGSGNPVTQLVEGTYTITVHDESTIHNFRLSGPGVNMATTVAGTGDATWTVTFAQGSYGYVCDPHADSMNGSFTVVAASGSTSSTSSTTDTSQTTSTAQTTTSNATTTTAATTTSAATTTTAVTTTEAKLAVSAVSVRVIRRGSRRLLKVGLTVNERATATVSVARARSSRAASRAFRLRSGRNTLAMALPRAARGPHTVRIMVRAASGGSVSLSRSIRL